MSEVFNFLADKLAIHLIELQMDFLEPQSQMFQVLL